MPSSPATRLRLPALLSAVAVFAACAGPRRGTPEPLSARALLGPEVAVDGSKLEPDRDHACLSMRGLRVPREQQAAAASDAGMLSDDLEALRGAASRLRVTVTLRDSNKACAPHLREGMESKGHDVLTKTFTADSLPAQFKYLAGTASTLKAKPPKGKILADPVSKRYLTPEGKPLTCDYDLMDMLEPDGARVPGQSDRDLAVREALDAALPLRGVPPHRVDRIKHGAQAQYPDYLRWQSRRGRPEPIHLEIDKPEAPLTALDKDGEVFRLETIEDALNFYRCAGADVIPEWNLRFSAGRPVR